MSKSEEKTNLAFKIFMAFIGVIVTGLGSGLMLKMGLGSTAVNSAYDGLSIVTGLTPGTVSIIVSLINILIAWLLKRNNIGIATVMFMFGVKYPLDLVYEYFPRPESLILRIIFCVIALVAIGAGASLCGATSLGFGPYDSFIMGFHERTKIKYVYVRYIFDGIYLLSCYLMGGAVGIGTILSLLMMGTVFSTCLKTWKRLFKFD